MNNTAHSAAHYMAHWHGSQKTAEEVKQQIRERWGDDEAEKYDPKTNCFTFRTWWALGYVVKKGEKALQSYTPLEEEQEDENGQKAVVKHAKTVYLFYYLQVEKRLNPFMENK